MAYELARYWGEYMSNHGTSATVTALPKDKVDVIYQDCNEALNSGEDFGWLKSWIDGVQQDIYTGIYHPKWKIEQDVNPLRSGAVQE